MLGEKIELAESVDSIYDFILDVSYGDREVIIKLYQNGICMDEVLLSGDYENKKQFKNQMKRGIYQILSGFLKKELPWGTLTGIRPTKIAFDGFDHGKTESEITEQFKQQYLTSGEKSKLCTEVVKRERELLQTFPYVSGYSLYVGIPFCPSTCLYCSFTSYSIETYKDLVEELIRLALKRYNDRHAE